MIDKGKISHTVATVLFLMLTLVILRPISQVDAAEFGTGVASSQ